DSEPEATEGRPPHTRCGRLFHNTAKRASGRSRIHSNDWDITVGMISVGGADRSAPTEALASRQGRRGVGRTPCYRTFDDLSVNEIPQRPREIRGQTPRPSAPPRPLPNGASRRRALLSTWTWFVLIFWVAAVACNRGGAATRRFGSDPGHGS